MGEHVAVTEENRVKAVFSPRVRAYLYGIFLACSPVAIYYGIVSDDAAGLWITVVGSILGVTNGLALANTPGVSKPVKE